MSYATKELSRDLTAPTSRSLLKLKHLLRYLAGTKDYVNRLRAGITLSSNKCTLDWTVLWTVTGLVVCELENQLQALL